MTDREKHIKNLSYIMDSMPDDACSEWRDSLAYAISSLKTDKAYQLMYEEEEIYTKADLVSMLTELQTEIEKQCKIPNNNASAYDWNNGVYSCYKVVQQKIDKLKGVEE